MKVRIEDIIVKDRIRKKFGRIDELADDIRENGLISPPVVTPDLELIAGERRLRALRMIGYEEIEVRIMEVRDYEHMLNLEINENESRLDFTKKERIDYARQLEELERMKARKRMGEGTENFPELDTGETRNLVAAKMGIGSGRQYDKEKYIVDNADPETLDAWDKGNISTHKAYMKLKEEKEAAERRAQEAEKALQEERAKPPEVVEKVVQKIVHKPPSDYAENIDENRKLRIRLMNEETRMKELAEENKRLKIKAKENEAAEQLADEYIELKKKLRTIAQSNSDSTNFMMALSDVIDFTTEVEHMLETKLAPIKYKRAFRLIANDPDVLDNVQNMVAEVTRWSAEITELIEGAKTKIYPYGKYEEEEDYERLE